MKKKLIWAAALRSGEYEQANSRLCRQVGASKYTHCCLGVAFDVLADDEWEWDEQRQGYGIVDPTEEKLFLRMGSLPSTVLGEIGLTHGEEGTLIRMNDTLNYSFEQIARYIEKEMA